MQADNRSREWRDIWWGNGVGTQLRHHHSERGRRVRHARSEARRGRNHGRFVLVMVNVLAVSDDALSQ